MTVATSLREQLQEHTDVSSTRAWAAGDNAAIPGDCWRACLASLFEVPIADVPHFVALHPDVDDGLWPTLGPQWWRASIEWVGKVRPGWTLAAWDVPDPWTPIYPLNSDAPDRVILSGRSTRGDWSHAVLVWDVDGALAHDPYPGGTGVRAPYADRITIIRKEQNR
ncbi:hypothetical protein [Microbacterium sp. 3J1]|uniref:hypothetical protein n=1 Tax=Microbacterium sp. 3J1 TaxID=861269 RepID=UPI000A6B8154|nr:hypothetical protein [Microbacterium sp. 3J1]